MHLADNSGKICDFQKTLNYYVFEPCTLSYTSIQKHVSQQYSLGESSRHIVLLVSTFFDCRFRLQIECYIVCIVDPFLDLFHPHCKT